MSEKYLSFYNPNSDALVVPQQEGSDEDDRYFGSIGDATMRHVGQLDPSERMLWEDLYTSPDGNIFRSMPSYDSLDPDPENLRGKDLDEYARKIKAQVSPDQWSAIEEAIENEKDRRIKELRDEEGIIIGNPDDALNKETVPYDEWEKFPQLWANVEIPNTPKDRYIFMGECKSNFYDYMPSGHPDIKAIQGCLNILNRNWDQDIDDSYVEFAKKCLDKNWTYRLQSTKHILSTMIDRFASGLEDYDLIVQQTLQELDQKASRAYHKVVVNKALQQPMVQLIVRKEKEWQTQADEGYNVYPAIKKFGQTLFTHFGKQMDTWLWTRYRKAKTLHAPRVMMNGIDINRASRTELRNVLNLTQNESRDLFFARPFENSMEAFNKGYIKAKCFSSSDLTDKVIAIMEKHSNFALEHKSVKRMASLQQLLFSWQRDKSVDLDRAQWGMVWKYYNILNHNVKELVNAERNKKEA